MKHEKSLSDFKPLQLEMEADKDPYIFVHFSREDDWFGGFTSKDMGYSDAEIIIKHLANKFNMSHIIEAMG